MDISPSLRKIIQLICEAQYKCDIQRFKTENVCEDSRNLLKKWHKENKIKISEKKDCNQNEIIQLYSPDEKIDNLLTTAKKLKEKYNYSDSSKNNCKIKTVSDKNIPVLQSSVKIKTSDKMQQSCKKINLNLEKKNQNRLSSEDKQKVTSSQQNKLKISTAVMSRNKFVKLKTHLDDKKHDRELQSDNCQCEIKNKNVTSKHASKTNENIIPSLKMDKSKTIDIPDVPKRIKKAVLLNLQARTKVKEILKENNSCGFAERFYTKLQQSMEIQQDDDDADKLKENCNLGQSPSHINQSLNEFNSAPLSMWHNNELIPIVIPETIYYSNVTEVNNFYDLLSDIQWLSLLLNIYKIIESEVLSDLPQINQKDGDYWNLFRCLYSLVCTKGESFPILISK